MTPSLRSRLFPPGRRAELVREFDLLFGALLREIIRYRTRRSRSATVRPGTVCPPPTKSRRISRRRRDRDRLFGTTTSGPHRDVCSYVRSGREYSHFASTGQLRLCALALRVAQARFLSERTSRTPVLLVDDVLLELDPERKRAFLARFPRTSRCSSRSSPTRGWRSYRTMDTLVLEVEAGDFASVGDAVP